MVEASPKMQKYFENLKAQVNIENEIAGKARAQNQDPENFVEVRLAENMAERVVGLISVVAPQIVGSGVVNRIIELEKMYGSLDWRVAFKIAEEIAQQKLCKFDDKLQAIDVGIRTGFAYSTVGVVSSPLDGFIGFDIKKRRDGRGEYFCLNYAGPIRNAGGTNAAVSVLIADYVRRKMGYDVYDADDLEKKRCFAELQDYHDRVTNLQYKPYEREINFLMSNMPVEVGGDPSERIEVSNYKDLPRVPTNLIRSGFCLLMSSCIPLKAPKLWKKLSVWGKEFEMDQWNFLEKFIKIQKEEKSKGNGGKKKSVNSNLKISPDYTFIADIVAGRPVLTHPLRAGGFRLRYGRSRASGYSGQAIHPMSMHMLNDYIATGTQCKVERPGKGAAYTPCDTIEGPIIKLKDGTVLFLEGNVDLKFYKKELEEILFLGDVLINYGDFFDRAHKLVPAGYCEEWWIKEFEKKCVELFASVNFEKISELTNIPIEFFKILFKNFFLTRPSGKQSVIISEKIKIPLHPRHTFHWTDISKSQFVDLLNWLKKASISLLDGFVEKIVLPKNPAKRVLECLGVPHVMSTDFIVIESEFAIPFAKQINFQNISDLFEIIKRVEIMSETNVLDIINNLSKLKIRDKSGISIGARMGRPEKAKMRKLTGSPQVLFPVGDEGGKTRSFQNALKEGKVTSDFPLNFCEKCNKDTVYPVCEVCNSLAKKRFYCRQCKVVSDDDMCDEHGDNVKFRRSTVDVEYYFNKALKKLNMKTYPDLIKGVKGTRNKEHFVENLAKGIIRSKFDLYVNKDGTIRYDASELPMTHFKPKEIGTPIEKLIEMGYDLDIKGKPLIDNNQVLEIKPQDIILPSCPEAVNEGSDTVMFRVTKFIDELLVKFYNLPAYYNLQSKSDLVGHLIIGLAPHTSAGMLGRIIGFSKTQGFLCHPYFHAAERRDCDGDEIGYMLLLDGFLNFSRSFLPNTRGATMDAPLVLTSVLAPAEVDDMAFNVDIVWEYPLEFYEAALEYKNPWDVKIKLINNTLNTPAQYEGMGFTHDFNSVNDGVRCSAYKTLPSMVEKLEGQMDIAVKIRAVDTPDVARLIIEKHFIKDTKGNLRKFSIQKYRCVKCNTKYRRPPLSGKCSNKRCTAGKIIFTISEGSVIKYLQYSIDLAEKYHVSNYLKQTLDFLRQRVDSVFGREKEKQSGLNDFFA